MSYPIKIGSLQQPLLHRRRGMDLESGSDDDDADIRLRPLRNSPHHVGNNIPRQVDSMVHDTCNSVHLQESKHLFQETRLVRLTLRLLGYIPVALPCDHWNRLQSYFNVCVCMAALATNAYMFWFNLALINTMRQVIGMMHVDTMTTVLTGVKPLQNFVCLTAFFLLRKRHRALFESLRNAQSSFKQHFQTDLPWARRNIVFLTLTSTVGILSLLGRIAQYLLTAEQVPPGSHFLNDISLILVPLLTLWQLVPLFYFDYLNRILQFWFGQLERALKRDYDLKKHSMNFYYKQYLLLTKTVQTMGFFFNPFIFFSLGISVLVLCLTIYFVINADIAIRVPVNATAKDEVALYFFPMWAGIQIAAAFCYILIIAVSGLRTNEQGRAVLTTVLTMAPRDENGRFQVVLFVHKIQTQYAWGITVWRAFPVERSLLFTMFGLISTYAVVLLKLQKTMIPEIENG